MQAQNVDTKSVENVSGNNQIPLHRIDETIRTTYTIKDIEKMFSNAFLQNPDVRNIVLKNIKTMPYLPRRDEVERALSNPRQNEKLLRSIGSSLFYNCYPLYKLLRFYSDVLTYRNYIHSQGVKPEAMNKPRFKKEKRFVQNWIDKLQVERTFRRITNEVFKEGKRAYVWMDEYEEDKRQTFEIEENKKIEIIEPSFDEYKRKTKYVMLRELPDDYIKIVGVSPNSYYTIAFNFNYFFENNGADIDGYPPIFKEYFNTLSNAIKTSDNKRKNQKQNKTSKFFEFDNNKLNGLKVKTEYDSIKNISYYWVDMPSSEVEVFSTDESDSIQVPNFIGLYLMSVDLQGYSLLQQQLTGIPLHSFIVGSIPMNKDDKKSSMALDEQTATFFTELFNNMMPDGTRYFMTPSQDNKFFSFNEQQNSSKIYTSALQDLISSSGMAGLLSNTDKPSLAQIKTSQLLESRYADILYPQYENCVNRRLERLTSKGYLRYNWRFRIFGNKFEDEKNQDLVNKNLSLGQTFYLPKALSYQNLSMCDAEDIANEVIAAGIYDKMLPLISSYQLNGKESEKGRPTTDDSDVDSDNTAKSKEAGSNTSDGRVRMTASELEELYELRKQVKRLTEMIEERGEE